MTHPPLLTSPELRSATSGKLFADLAIHGVCIDTRQLQEGDLFIALAGHHSDGHQYIAQAFERGAACVMAHSAESVRQAGFEDDPRILMVEDTFHGLKALGRFARARFQGTAIAITGSVGKTTTKEMLRLALSAYGKVHASVASYNNHWGVPLTLARLPQEARFCISEIGMNHPGEIAPLAAQIRPERAVITTIGSAHLGHMGSLEAIAREKAALLASLPPQGIALVPDNALYHECFIQALPKTAELWWCGERTNATIRLGTLNCKAEGSIFKLHTPKESLTVTLHAPGAHLARNATLVLGVVASLGLPLQPAITALETFQTSAGRGQYRRLANGAYLLDESYNASGPSIRAALETLALLPAKRYLAALGDVLELGQFSEEEHRALANPIIAHNVLCFCCGKHMKSLYDTLPESLRGGYAQDATQLAPLVKDQLHMGDILLVKGSSGSRMHALVATLDSSSTV